MKRWETEKQKQYMKQYHDKYDHEYYQRNKEKIKNRKKQYKLELRDWYYNLKSTLKCIFCGENDPRCLDFHHIDPKTKDMNCANFLNRSCKSKLLEEIKKCDIICANCHRKLTVKI